MTAEVAEAVVAGLVASMRQTDEAIAANQSAIYDGLRRLADHWDLMDSRAGALSGPFAICAEDLRRLLPDGATA